MTFGYNSASGSCQFDRKMFSTLKRIIEFSRGPTLIREHGHGQRSGNNIIGTSLYVASSAESWSSHTISLCTLLCKVSLYCAPVLAVIFWRSDLTTRAGPALKVAVSLALIVSSCFCIRGYSRSINQQYVKFFRVLTAARKDPEANFAALRLFDFDFDAWPVDFDCDKLQKFGSFVPVLDKVADNSITRLPLRVLAEIAIRLFALKLIYPGSMYILQLSINQHLVEGRTKLIESNRGIRYKVGTLDGNQIDTMFVDNRGKSTNGSTLVLTSEGNAGFYELGIMSTPIEANYSVLGWNHPGFGGSTGQPYPDQEHRAMDAVMQFAIHKLGFSPDRIILFGWSIGAYPSAWAAVQYPDIKGVVLDAAFDDILPLALSKMPTSWNSLVTEVIRGHADLRIAKILDGYAGPIKFVRRTADEIICIEEGKISTNRGNDLLLHTLCKRYPEVFDEEGISFGRQFLGSRGPALVALLQNEATDKKKKVLFLINEHLQDYQSSHCTPLPPDYFNIPKPVRLGDM